MMEHLFESREAASVAAAEKVTCALRRRLDAGQSTSLVVSGGTTPARCFEELAKQDIAWRKVGVLASDDRWVPPAHDDSNEKLIRDTLLVGNAKDADFLPFYAEKIAIEEQCRILNEDIRLAPLPFACALLGMGTDGHFASLFPDAENLKEGLDVNSLTLCIPVQTAASPHLRVSLTLSALARSDEIVLLFFGDDKRAVYEDARNGNINLPVARLLRQKRAPVSVYWAP